MSGTGAGASYGDLLVTSLLVLGAVCIAAFVAVRMFGRVLATGRARGRHLLDVVARVPLEPRRSLYVVEVAGKTLLVGTSEMGLSVLSELDGSEVKARVEQQPTFGELVRRAFGQRRGFASMRAEQAGGVPAEARTGVSAEARAGVSAEARTGVSAEARNCTAAELRDGAVAVAEQGEMRDGVDGERDEARIGAGATRQAPNAGGQGA